MEESGFLNPIPDLTKFIPKQESVRYGYTGCIMRQCEAQPSCVYVCGVEAGLCISHCLHFEKPQSTRRGVLGARGAVALRLRQTVTSSAPHTQTCSNGDTQAIQHGCVGEEQTVEVVFKV